MSLSLAVTVISNFPFVLFFSIHGISQLSVALSLCARERGDGLEARSISRVYH